MSAAATGSTSGKGLQVIVEINAPGHARVTIDWNVDGINDDDMLTLSIDDIDYIGVDSHGHVGHWPDGGQWVPLYEGGVRPVCVTCGREIFPRDDEPGYADKHGFTRCFPSSDEDHGLQKLRHHPTSRVKESEGRLTVL
jgi:hypothetical protein